MIYKLTAGAAAVLALLTFTAFRVNTTGSYARTFNASSDQVWRVWTDPDSIKMWWGPKDYTAPVIKNDPRVEGTYLWSMKSLQGRVFWNTGVYKEVVPNIRLVSTMSFADATGNAIPGSQAPVPGHWPNEILVRTEFTEAAGRTTVTVTEAGLPLIVELLSKMAWRQQFDKADFLLKEMPKIARHEPIVRG